MMPATDDAISIREFFAGEVASIRREIHTLIANIDRTAVIHAESHAREHQMTQTAVNKAEEAMTIRLEQMNQFRSQIEAERTTLATKAEMREALKRLEEIVGRNTTDMRTGLASLETTIAALELKLDERLKSVELFANNSRAQAGTLRTLMAVLLFAVTLVGFFLAVSR